MPNSSIHKKTEKAILAGGCFWGMQKLIKQLPGVCSTRVGYTGGDIPHATYKNHTGHAEAVEIMFDPKILSYRTLLEYFFRIHDPTTLNQQGNDIGTSYRSAIFYTSQTQKETAQALIKTIEKSQKWPGHIVTTCQPEKKFWEAEPEHQNYLDKFPTGYNCHFERKNWTLSE